VTRFEKRIQSLEQALQLEPTVLFFADGSTAELRGSLHFGRLCRAMGDEKSASPDEQAALGLIRRSVRCQEPGGAHMIELLRAILLSPNEPSPENDPPQ
jgi:hypothetical protein